jgi:hypothetical protein
MDGHSTAARRLAAPQAFLYDFLTMARMPKPKRKRSPDQMRIWLATVLSPMLRGLDVELEFVERHNWSFRCDSQDFEYLWPTAMMIAVPHHADAEQVFRYHPSVRTSAASHDRALAELRESCQKAYEKLMQSPSFSKLGLPDGDQAAARRYFSEYVINGLRDLPSHYIFSDFWKAHGGEYLSLRSDPSLAPYFKLLDAHGDSLRRDVVALRRTVKKLQESIADEAGLAPVDPALI